MADQANSERLRRLEDDVNQRVREAFGGLREQVAERLRRLSDEALEALERLGEGEAPAVLAAADLEPLTREAAREAETAAARRAGDELLAALAAVDRAGSQGEVLSALAHEAARFAPRAAVLLTRPAGAELWAAEGWGGAPSSLAFSYPSADGWSPEEFGRGAVELTGDAREELSGRLDADAPAHAVLVPLVLRDRLAAVLYADSGAGEDAPAPAAAPLQVLTWAASQALESLPFRRRAATPTLAGLDGGDRVGEALALRGSEGEAAGAGAAPAGAEHGHHTGRAVGYAAAGIAAAGLAAAGVAAVRRERAGHEEEEGEAPAQPAAGEGAGSLAAFDEIVLEEGPGPEVAAPPVPHHEATPEPSSAPETAAVEAGWSFADRFEDDEALAASAADADEVSPDDETAIDLGAGDEEGAATAAYQSPGRSAAGFAFDDEPTVLDLDDDGERAGLEEEGAFEEDEAVEETHPATVPMPRADAFAPPAESAAAESAEETYPGFATSPPPTAVPAPPVAAPPVAAPPAEGSPAEVSAAEVSAAPSAAPAASGGAQVAPPPDLEGPGRAFAGRREAPDEEQARHEEARRLARLLVSEIRLYNEEEVEAGRRHGDVYERLKEDIDRSRQLYDERVDARVREGTDYFYQELVRNLGGGDAKALGI